MATILIDILKQKNRNNTITTGDFFHVVDSSDIDFRIQGIQEDNTLDPGTTDGYRYIVKNINNLNLGFTGSSGDWGNNDILWFNGASGAYQVFLDASNSEGKQSGTIVFNEGDSKFYGFDGTDWLELGSGAVGTTGATGSQGFQGVIGPTGFQGFQGVTGPIGFQGFQGLIGSTGVQGFQGVTGPTGVQGFQGHNGPTGFQGFQGVAGPTGVQGFQGTTGAQGPLGLYPWIFIDSADPDVNLFQAYTYSGILFKAESGINIQGSLGDLDDQGNITGPIITFTKNDYFYGPTAPDESDGLTIGVKWFNTEVGGEFTYLSDPNNQPYWVMTNVFSATGPQGPLGGGTGNQGFQGPTGPKGDPGEAAAQGNTGPTGFQGFQGHTGFQGFQGVTGPSGFQGFQGYTGFQGFQGTTGAKGETGDGLFDRTYATGTNVNNSINYNSIGNVSGTGRKFPVLLDDGSLTFDFIRTTDLFNNFTISSFDLNESSLALIGTGSFSLNGRTFSVSYTPDIIDVSSASIDVNTTNSGYPLSLSSPYTSVSANGTSIDYPASKNTTITFTITATASDGSSDTATDIITFRQYNYWGIGSETGITVGNLSSLSNNQLLSNRTKTFTVNPSVGEYIYYGYPESYGDATFRVDGIIGGFQKITISGGETHTNANSYDEKYRIYRSDFANLGNTTVEVT